MNRRMAVELDLIIPEAVDTITLLHAIDLAVHELGGGTLSSWAGTTDIPKEETSA